MIDASEARKLADVKTDQEALLEDIGKYIEIEATKGERKMQYRIDEVKYSERVVSHIIWCLEQLHGYDVYYDKENFMLTIKW